MTLHASVHVLKSPDTESSRFTTKKIPLPRGSTSELAVAHDVNNDHCKLLPSENLEIPAGHATANTKNIAMDRKGQPPRQWPSGVSLKRDFHIITFSVNAFLEELMFI
jgi:hypothetical protein